VPSFLDLSGKSSSFQFRSAFPLLDPDSSRLPFLNPSAGFISVCGFFPLLAFPCRERLFLFPPPLRTPPWRVFGCLSGFFFPGRGSTRWVGFTPFFLRDFWARLTFCGSWTQALFSSSEAFALSSVSPPFSWCSPFFFRSEC